MAKMCPLKNNRGDETSGFAAWICSNAKKRQRKTFGVRASVIIADII